MDEILEIANRYYRATEHPKFWLLPHLNYQFSLFLISVASFGVCFYLFYPQFNGLHNKELFTNLYFGAVLSLEIISVILWRLSIDRKNKIVILYNFPNQDVSNKTIKDVKIKLLNEILGTDESNYNKKANMIIDIYKVSKKIGRPFVFNVENITSKIYNNEAKSMVIAWIAILISILTALLFKADISIYNIFYFYRGINTTAIIFLYSVAILFIAALLVIAGGILNFLNQFFFLMSIWLDKEKSKNTKAVDILIRDLLQYSKSIKAT